MKKELRKEIIAARMAQTDEEIKVKSSSAAEKLWSLEAFRKAVLVMFYLDFRKEVATGDMIARCLAEGKRVVIPITDTVNTRLIPSEILHFPDDLTPGTWGILEPKADCVRPVDPAEIDFVIVPGVSFDTKGNRLGYGGGFYDRFLPQTREDTTYAALAFELQIRDNVYPEAHDRRVHYVITEDRLMNCK